MAGMIERVTIGTGALATGFPSTTLKACLKQVNVAGLDERTRQVLEACFPRFGWSPKQSADAFANSLGLDGHNVRWTVTGSGLYHLDQGRYRRYAGGRDLPPARYYSVCSDETGNDGGTLCYELMSYWDSTNGVYPSLVDSTVHLYARPAIADPAIDELSRASGPVLKMFVMNMQELVIIDGGKVATRGEMVPIAIPLQLREVHCENVLDMRLPAAQDWLARQWGGSGDVKGFGSLLPNLISPTPGGSQFHQGLGAWLRQQGCQGLVFPSARRDVAVDAGRDEVLASDGWNFVRYDGAPPPSPDMKIQAPFPWKGASDIGAQIFYREVQGVRSWRVQGPEAGEWGRVGYEVRRSRGLAPPPSTSFNPFDDGRRTWCKEGTPFAPLEPDR